MLVRWGWLPAMVSDRRSTGGCICTPEGKAGAESLFTTPKSRGYPIPSVCGEGLEDPISVSLNTIRLQVPLVFYYGHPSPAEYPEHYKALVQQLAQLLDRREALNAQVWQLSAKLPSIVQLVCPVQPL